MTPVVTPKRCALGLRSRSLLLATLVLTATAARPLPAQSVLTRPPDMHGTWVGAPGTLYFHFLHRFESTPAPTRKVVNYPTFLLAAALPANVLVGAHYATNSLLVSGYPNEWEYFARVSPLRQADQAPVDLAVTAAFNQPARSWDGELALARNLGPLRLLAAGRAFSNFRRSGEARFAAAGGAILRLNRFVALAGDVSSLLDPRDGEEVGWGAGLQLAIPYTPHTLSLQVSNSNTTTLEGASTGAAQGRIWGFEFTVPLTLSRWFGSDQEPQGAASASAAVDATAEVTMSNQLKFSPAVVHIKAGETVRWRNASDLVHTVILDPKLAAKPEFAKLPEGAEPFNSGDLKPGETFAHTFTVPGEYVYFCIPHAPAVMIARVVVEK